MCINRVVTILFLFWVCLPAASATHNRAGEITIKQTGDLTIEVTVTTYTKTSSVQADRDSVLVHWGDGTSEFIARANGDGFPLPNNRKLNYYIATHTYPGRAAYTISMMDPNRNGGILNVNPPNSEAVPFYIEATYTFLNPQFQGYNNTAVLLEPPIDYACVGRKFIHNPSAYDPDGDSLAFELIVPMQDSGVNVPNYIHPTQIGPGPGNQMYLNPLTGDLIWTTPKIAGEYNIAFRVNEYRQGVLISSFIRDMQILVLVCDNSPPEITTANEICVVAGEVLDLSILITDPDFGQLVRTSASGGPFEVPGTKAVFEGGDGQYLEPPINARLFWAPDCEHIREQPYTVIIKALDNAFDTAGLADLHAINIRVVGPPPENPQLERAGDAFHLSWDQPYVCDMTRDNYFRGFSIWRRTGSNQFVPDTCETGLAGRGYTRIAVNSKDVNNGRYFFMDTDIRDEENYCYRILAEFALTTPAGQPYARVISIPSAEVCLRARADRPLITHATINATDDTNGEITVRWIHPDAAAVDTIQYPGPYSYQVMQATGIQGLDFEPVPGGQFSADFFAQLRDSMVVISNVDTRLTGYNFRIDFFTGPQQLLRGSSIDASTVFLTAIPSDEAVNLVWEANVPWDNYAYEVWRQEPGGSFELLGSVSDEHFEDRSNVVNGQEYCYVIKAYGDYGLTDVASPLINLSQEACAIPQDNVAPCPPSLSVTNICDQSNPQTPADAFVNYIFWTLSCSDDDTETFQVFYTPKPGSEWELIGTVNAPTSTLEHKPGEHIAGCYAVVAVDEQGNQSEFSSVVCVGNCPVYELPNAFTPNGDGQNDIFKPFQSRFIERVDFKVYNRWGQVVFTTTDPNLNWTGHNNAGAELSDGVYYYTCEVFESQVASPFLLSGYIELIRG